MGNTKRYPEESVLVVERTLFEELGTFQGLNMEVNRYLNAFLDPANNYFLERDEAEEDPSRKQIIPYAIFHHQGRFLHYVRGGKSGEKRLASKGSLGIGGHINQEDEEASSLEKDVYMTGVEREVHEELKLGSAYEQKIVALINDDSNEVGAVHLGVVHVFDLASDDVKPNEANIAELGFYTREELKSKYDALETWSQILFDQLDDILESVALVKR